MKWISISGSWRATSPEVEADVRKAVQEIIARGDGVVTGGSLNVDYFATDEALRLDPYAAHIKVFLPTTLERYDAHVQGMVTSGRITQEQADMLIAQLTSLRNVNADALIEDTEIVTLDNAAYVARNQSVIDASDELMAFQVNQSPGTQDAMDKARAQGKPVVCTQYTLQQ